MKNLNDYIGKLVSMRDDVVYVVTSARSVKQMNPNYNSNIENYFGINSEYIFDNEVALTDFKSYMYGEINNSEFVRFERINFILLDSEKLRKLIELKTEFASLKKKYDYTKEKIESDVMDFIRDEDNLKFG